MIETKYLNNTFGEPALFELIFPLSDYIPKRYFQKHGENAEIYFYIDLFIKNDLFSGKKEDFYESPTFDCIYNCSYKGIPFTMCCDNFYGIWFTIDENRLSFRQEIAEYVKMLIEQTVQ